jgi:hypothetical protein
MHTCIHIDAFFCVPIPFRRAADPRINSGLCAAPRFGAVRCADEKKAEAGAARVGGEGAGGLDSPFGGSGETWTWQAVTQLPGAGDYTLQAFASNSPGGIYRLVFKAHVRVE